MFFYIFIVLKMSEKFILFSDEFENIIKKKSLLSENLADEYKRMWESCDQWWDTWHDNFDFEDANRNVSMISSMIVSLNHIISNSKILVLENLNVISNTIHIGRVVEFEIEWILNTLMIWWYGSNIKWRVAYNAPLWKALLGKKVGDVFEFTFNGKSKTIKILNIK